MITIESKNDNANHLYNKYGFTKKRSIKEYLSEFPLEAKTFPSDYF